MSKIAIVTDTNTSLSSEFAAQHSIHQVPITVYFGDDMFET